MNVDFSFCLISIRKLNFSWTESIFTGNTSFCQSTWHGFYLPSVNKKVDLPSVNKNQIFGTKFKNIIKYNIPHTPLKVGVLVRMIFSHTPEEAMSGGLAKACVPSKNSFCSREIAFPNEDQTEWEVYIHLIYYLLSEKLLPTTQGGFMRFEGKCCFLQLYMIRMF